MSEKFEEIVLKKLEKLDKRLDKQEEVQNDIMNKLKLQDVIVEKINNLETEMEDFKSEVGNLKLEVKDTQEIVNYLNNKFTKFDYEINKKIDTLFDTYNICKEKDIKHEENIASLNAKVFNQDIRISNLENNFMTA